MPLSEVNCTPGWFPPEGGTMSPKQALVVALVNPLLPELIANAVNQVDEPDDENKITDGQVFINIGRIHAHAANASDLQIIIRPGFGGLHVAPPEQRVRRVAIREFVQAGLEEMRAHTLSTVWPSYDIEVIPTGMSGLSVSSAGKVTSTWGNVPE